MPTSSEIETAILEWLCKKHPQVTDARSHLTGRQHMQAETHELAHGLTELFKQIDLLNQRTQASVEAAVKMLAPVAAPAVAAMKQRPEFMPVIGTRRTLFVPMAILSEEQAQANHSQSLARLAERGGLGLGEIVANMHRKPLYKVNMSAPADAYLTEIKRVAERMGRL